jgi:hypothetical protein
MDGWRRVHRILAGLFLLTIPPAAYFSFTGDPDSPHPIWRRTVARVTNYSEDMGNETLGE